MNPLKILVIFAEDWAAYSPTFQNLMTLLEDDPRFDPHGLCFDDGEHWTTGLDERRYERVSIRHRSVVNDAARKKIGTIPGRMADWLNARVFPHEKVDAYTMEKIRLLAMRLRGRTYDHVIAIDPVAMVVASVFFDSVTFLSLEFLNNRLLQWISETRYHAVIIQNEARYQLLFPGGRHRKFFIQNSHIFEGRVPRTRNQSIIYFGNIGLTHGLNVFPGSLAHLPGHTLTLKGIISAEARATLETRYSRCIAEGRLVLEETHVAQSDVVAWLRQFGIGFCFYDIDHLKRVVTRSNVHLVDHFLNCPSGKLFNYFAAGIPVIANDIPGLQSVAEHGAGILLKDPSPEHIAEAVHAIEADYDRYVDGAYRAAEAYDFARMAAPYLEELSSIAPATQKNFVALEHSLRIAGFLSAFRKEVQSPITPIIRNLADNLDMRPLVIYGAGEHTELLLRKHGLGRLNITAIADGDRGKTGTRFMGYPVIEPDQIREFADDVFISSYAHETSIISRIESRFGADVRIHRMYAKVP